VKVEIWSDVICPWCGIGQNRLDLALAAFEHRDDVEVVHRSFQLDENAPMTPRSAREVIAKKYGVSEAQMTAMAERIESVAAADGLGPYHVADNLTGNTRQAHELLALAADRGFEDAAWKRLYHAHFGEKRSIFDRDALVALGVEIGLDPVEVRAVLNDGRYKDRVEADGQQARAFGSTGVPFVVIDRRYAVAGAQPVEVFREALEQAWPERPQLVQAAESDALCGPDGCAV